VDSLNDAATSRLRRLSASAAGELQLAVVGGVKTAEPRLTAAACRQTSRLINRTNWSAVRRPATAKTEIHHCRAASASGTPQLSDNRNVIACCTLQVSKQGLELREAVGEERSVSLSLSVSAVLLKGAS